MSNLFYQRSGETIEIVVRDLSMRKIESWKFSIEDKSTTKKVLHHLKDKYGFSPEVDEHVPKLSKDPFFDQKVNW